MYVRNKKLKARIVKIALAKIGTNKTSLLDGGTFFIFGNCYNIYILKNGLQIKAI